MHQTVLGIVKPHTALSLYQNAQIRAGELPAAVFLFVILLAEADFCAGPIGIGQRIGYWQDAGFPG